LALRVGSNPATALRKHAKDRSGCLLLDAGGTAVVDPEESEVQRLKVSASIGK
jgi:hypothetical protein